MSSKSSNGDAPHSEIRNEYPASGRKPTAWNVIHDPLKQAGLEVVPTGGDDGKHLVDGELYNGYEQPGLEVRSSGRHDDKVPLSHEYPEDKHVFAEEGKEWNQPEKMVHETWTSTHQPESEAREPTRRRPLCGISRTIFYAVVVAVLLAIGLAIGLGVGLTSRDSDERSLLSSGSNSSRPLPSSSTPSSAAPTSSATPQIGGTIDASYYSRSGAWNGTGIAYVWQNFTQGWDDILRASEFSHVVYFQHPSGDIRWMRETADYSWKEGAQDLLVVATDARNSTPISAVQYTANNTNHWNVFYVDNDNFVRQRSGGNRSNGWTEGSIINSKLTAWNGDLVGLAACDSAINESIPLRLFYATNETAFEEYLWSAEADQWTRQQTWEGYSGSAGVGCFRGSDGYRYVGLVNLSNKLEIWYQSDADIHGDWQKAETEIANVHPASSITLDVNYAFHQANTTNAIVVTQMDWQDFYTSSAASTISPPDGLEGVSGTRMSAKQNGNYTWIFYQRDGDDVTWLERAPNSDRWQVKAPIPFA